MIHQFGLTHSTVTQWFHRLRWSHTHAHPSSWTWVSWLFPWLSKHFTSSFTPFHHVLLKQKGMVQGKRSM